MVVDSLGEVEVLEASPVDQTTGLVDSPVVQATGLEIQVIDLEALVVVAVGDIDHLTDHILL